MQHNRKGQNYVHFLKTQIMTPIFISTYNSLLISYYTFVPTVASLCESYQKFSVLGNKFHPSVEK